METKSVLLLSKSALNTYSLLIRISLTSFQIPAIISEHIGSQFSLITLLHQRNILMETFSLFISYSTEILRKKSSWERRK